MSPELATQFLAAIGCHEHFLNGEWLTAKCPLAPYLHKSGKDSNPSFGINLESGLFNCFACESGSLEKLVQTLEMYATHTPYMQAKYDFAAARQAIEGIDNDMSPLPEYAEFPDKKYVFEEWPEYFIEQFSPWNSTSLAIQYLANRVQPVDTVIADKMELKWDSTYQRIVCPYRTLSGKLAGARGRAIFKTSPMQHFDYTWNEINNANIVWYNEQALELSVEHDRPIVVVEGQFDAMNVMRVYPYVVAGLTAKASLPKISKLQNVPGVLTMLDNDATGQAAWHRYKKYLEGKVQLGRMDFGTEYKDPGAIPHQKLAELFAELI